MIQTKKYLVLLLILLTVQCNVFCNDPVHEDQNQEDFSLTRAILRLTFLPDIKPGGSVTLTEKELGCLKEGEIVVLNTKDEEQVFISRADIWRKVISSFFVAGVTITSAVLVPIIWYLYNKSASLKKRLDRQVRLASDTK